MEDLNSNRWRALGPDEWFRSPHSEATISQTEDQFSSTEQDSDEVIIVKDSCDITIHITDTKASVSLQLGLQLAIVLLVSITVGDTERTMAIANQIIQGFQTRQKNRRRIIIENSRNVSVIITETDISLNIQTLLQVLLAIVVKADIL